MICPLTHLIEKVNQFWSSLLDIPHETSSTRDVIDDKKLDLPIPFAYPYAFEVAKEFKGDISAYVNKMQ